MVNEDGTTVEHLDNIQLSYNHFFSIGILYDSHFGFFASEVHYQNHRFNVYGNLRWPLLMLSHGITISSCQA